MKAIYLDNYRGFRDELIELRAVNFFVGENSSGKTSLLVAISFLSKPELWTGGHFFQDLPFSSFSDFISRDGRARKYFYLGLSDTKAGASHDFRLIRFYDNHGLPAVQRFAFTFKGDLVVINLIGKVSYRVIKIPPELSLREIVEFTKQSITAPAKSFKSSGEFIKLPSGMAQRLGLGMLRYFVVRDLVENGIIAGEEDDAETLLDFYEGGCTWIAPIRAKPQRIYFEHSSVYSPEGGHVPYYLSSIIGDAELDGSKIHKKIKEFGAASGLFDDITIRRYGDGGAEPFEINIERNGVVTQINNVGYGVSQILPVVIEACRSGKDRFTSIQQPEVHLHPKAQAALGGLLHQVSVEKEARFLVETHSDYVIDRFRLAQSASDAKVESQVIFMERKEGRCNVYALQVDDQGHYPEKQPSAFRGFFLNEELALIRM